MIKRTKYYSVVRGVTVDNGEIHDCEVVVDGRVKTADKAMKRAKKINPNMLPTSAEYHAQAVTMTDEEFYAHCQLGEDTILYRVSGRERDNVVEDDIIEDNNNN